jgi:hypothetical protein
MSKRILRLVAVLSLTALGIGTYGCWGWHHPIDERGERRDSRREEHHEDHEREYR